jgi:hypothetical protein
MRYRIIEYQNHFEVQYKWLFWWFDVTQFECDTLGFGGDYVIRFYTRKGADKYIKDQRETKRIISKIYE